jgi:hypothetical protein
MHSLRRWFIWSAREALLKGTGHGYSPWTIAEVVGHAKGEVGLEITMRYAGDESLQAKGAVVEAVTRPPRRHPRARSEDRGGQLWRCHREGDGAGDGKGPEGEGVGCVGHTSKDKGTTMRDANGRGPCGGRAEVPPV